MTVAQPGSGLDSSCHMAHSKYPSMGPIVDERTTADDITDLHLLQLAVVLKDGAIVREGHRGEDDGSLLVPLSLRMRRILLAGRQQPAGRARRR